MNTPGQQVARREEQAPVKVDLSQPLTDLDQAMRLAEALSKSDLVPDSLHGHPASVLHVILTGQALDLHWTEAVRVIYSPGRGQIGMRAQFLLSQLRKAGHRYTAEYSDDGESCTFTLIRKDEPDHPYTATFSRQDAIDAKLVSKDNWTRYFKRMLRARAITDCVGFGAPEVLLGFVVEGDEAPPEPVVLSPQAPAPPPVTGEAATGEAAAQATQLRELDERMRGEGDAGQAVTTTGEEVTAPPPAGDPFAVEPDFPLADMPAQAHDAPDAGTLDTGSPSAPNAAPGAGTSADEPVDASGKAKDQVLSEWFTVLGYDPGLYRSNVLHACSCFVRRRITGVRDLRAAEVLRLTNELSVIFRRKDELAPVSRLADAVDTWAEAWRTGDPAGYAEYEQGK